MGHDPAQIQPHPHCPPVPPTQPFQGHGPLACLEAVEAPVERVQSAWVAKSRAEGFAGDVGLHGRAVEGLAEVA